MSNGKPTPKEWGQRHQAERLMQLRADTQDVCRRVWQMYYGLSLEAPEGMAEEWERKGNEVQDVLTRALTDIEKQIGECCAQQQQ